MNAFNLRIWLSLGIMCSLPEAQSQTRALLTFEQISIEQGLSQSIVFCLLQDQKGFMWFGTEDGVNKYDGYNFTVMRHEPLDSNSLWYNDVRALCEDKEGIIWIGTFYGGLNAYDPAKEKFTHYRHNPNDPNSLSHNNVRAILEDRTGALWIGTDGGLNKFDRATGRFTRYQHSEENPTSLSHNTVNVIYEDRAGGLWIGTDGGLNRLRRSDDGLPPTFQNYRHNPRNPHSLSNAVVTAIHQDHAGVLWIGTRSGLNKLDDSENTESSALFTRYEHEAQNAASLSHNDVRALFEDAADSVLWIGTNGGGLNLLDRRREKFIHYRNDPLDRTSLSYNEIYAIGADRAGIIWLGTYGGGLNKALRKQKSFLVYRRAPNNPNSLPHEIVWAIYEDENGVLWIGTHGGGLTRYDRKKNQYTHYQHDPANRHSLSHNIVRLIHPARGDSNVLWIGTHGGGLNRFDIRTKKSIRYLHDPDDPRSLSHNELRAIYQDRGGTLWIGTNGGGLNKLLPNDNASARPVFKHYQHDANVPTSISNDFVRTIYEDPDEAGDVLWIGTQGGGLNRFDRRTETFTHYRAAPGQRNSLNNDYVFCIHEDKAGMFWLGTWGGGLLKFDRALGAVGYYTTRQGLPSNEIYGILEDEEGNFWISSNKGLSRFNPTTETFKNYSVEDGLQSNEFNGGAFFKSKSGEMFFGGIHGFNSFDPQQITDNPNLPPVVITGFFKFNRPVKLEQSIAALEELHLYHKDYVFSFEFAALDFSAPRKNQYVYKMEGLDEEWIYTDAKKRFASYTTLSPGRYVFRVKGSNNDGLWNEQGTALKIVIHPPLWKTWWFSALVGLLAAGLAYRGYRQHLKAVRMKAELGAAHDAQMSIMPQADPQIAGFDISGVCLPANEVGGDFFDYIWLDEAQTKFGIVIGDVSGKAMQAAMTAVMANGMICAKTDENLPIKEIMTRLNRPMYAKIKREMFTALCFATLDLKTRELAFTNAGLIEPLLKRGTTAVYLEAVGCKHPLGIAKDDIYEETVLPLRSGDVLVFVTDGIVEEQNHRGEFYGEAALQKLVERLDTGHLTSAVLKTMIIAEVKRFSGITAQDDDMTVIVVKVL